MAYSDGEKIFHGQIADREVHEFMTGPDEFIVKVISSSGWMIDSLTFFTNKGTQFGPYGGDGGGQRSLEVPVKHGYLAYISGSEASTQGSLGIVNLAFHWQNYDFDGQLESSDIEPTIDIDDWFDNNRELIW